MNIARLWIGTGCFWGTQVYRLHIFGASIEKNKSYKKILSASFKIAVINNSPNAQVPQFGEVRETGDEGGDFIFILK